MTMINHSKKSSSLSPSIDENARREARGALPLGLLHPSSAARALGTFNNRTGQDTLGRSRKCEYSFCIVKASSLIRMFSRSLAEYGRGGGGECPRQVVEDGGLGRRRQRRVGRVGPRRQRRRRRRSSSFPNRHYGGAAKRSSGSNMTHSLILRRGRLIW